MLKVAPRQAPDYEEDFAGWAWAQAELLASRRFAELDLPNLIDEVNGLPQSEWNAIESNLLVVLTHLLKSHHQPSQRKGGWQASIREHRRRVRRLISKNPSFAPKLAEEVLEQYPLAHIRAAEETGLDYETFPEDCPFTREQVLDPEWLPDAAEGA
jgi:hypothetical protein